MRRPLLIPHMRRLWRDANTVQLGTDPRLATVLELADPATARVLDLLDGSRTERSVLATAAGLGVRERDAEALINALREEGLLLPERALLPVGLTDAQRERMAREAGALALADLAERMAVRVSPTPGAPAGPPPCRTGEDGPGIDRATSPHPTPPGSTPDGPTTGPTTGPTSSRTNGPASDTPPGAGGISLAVRPSGATPAEMLRRRAAARVLVAGHAWMGALVAAALGAAGIGRLDPALDGWTRVDDAMLGGLLPADAHRSRASAAADAVRRVAPEAVLTPLREGSATFVVRVGSRPGSALATRGVRQRTSPRLDVYLRDGVVVVGPLVLPDGSPCGQCLELHRRDRDRAWPVIAAQLATGRDTGEACSVTTALAGAAYAVEEVLRYTDGRPVRTVGATVEVAGPGLARRRSWPSHPGCDCSRRRPSSRSGRQPARPSNNGS